MSEGVIDVLEVIEIEEYHRHLLSGALRQCECVLHPIAEQAAVCQQRQRIMESKLPQLLLERLALADVTEVDGQAADCRVVQQVAADALERVAPRTAADRDLDGADRFSVSGGHFAQECGQPIAIGLGAELEQVAADQDIRMHREGALGGR